MLSNDIKERDESERKTMTRTLHLGHLSSSLEPCRVRMSAMRLADEKKVRVCALGQVYCLHVLSC